MTRASENVDAILDDHWAFRVSGRWMLGAVQVRAAAVAHFFYAEI
jgi:hypothetical protein